MPSLPDRLRLGLQALQQGEWQAVVDHLRPLVEDEAFRTQDDLRDLCSRALSWLAQAEFELGELSAANQHASEALAIVREIGDDSGERAVRALHGRIFAAATDKHRAAQAHQRARRLLETPWEELLESATDPAEQLSLTLQRATAEIEAGSSPVGAELARQAVALADSLGILRDRVLTRLTVARALQDDASDQLHDAWRLADAQDDHELIATVATVSEAVGIPIVHTLEGPG